MLCRWCGNTNPLYAVFCNLCGVKADKVSFIVCSQCEKNTPDDGLFCNWCGTAVPSPKVPESVQNLSQHLNHLRVLLANDFLTQAEFDARRLKLAHVYMKTVLGKDITQPDCPTTPSHDGGNHNEHKPTPPSPKELHEFAAEMKVKRGSPPGSPDKTGGSPRAARGSGRVIALKLKGINESPPPTGNTKISPRERTSPRGIPPAISFAKAPESTSSSFDSCSPLPSPSSTPPTSRFEEYMENEKSRRRDSREKTPPIVEAKESSDSPESSPTAVKRHRRESAISRAARIMREKQEKEQEGLAEHSLKLETEDSSIQIVIGKESPNNILSSDSGDVPETMG